MLPKTRVVLLLILLCVTALSAAPLRHIPHGDPSYAFLDRAYARGWIRYLPQTRPYTYSQALSLLDEAEEFLAAHPHNESPLIEGQMAGFRARFGGPEQHVVGLDWGENSSASLDFPLYLDTNLRVHRPWEAFAGLGPGVDLRASIENRLYLSLEVFYGASLATWQTPPFAAFAFPHREDYAVYHFFLTRDGSGFDHRDQLGVLHARGEVDLFFWMNLVSQNTIDFSLGTLSLARGSLDWGPSPLANLAVSAATKPYEYVDLRIPLGERASYTWATGFLQDFTGAGAKDYVDKLLNVHRLEVQITDWLLMSIYESIVYSKRFELAYLNPLGVYAVSEVQRGDYDNKFGGFDATFRVPPVRMYLAFFVDDWDFGYLFNPFYYHNEWGGIVGIQAFDLVPGLSLNAEYILLTHWMYTHRADLSDAENNYNRYVHFDTHLGHFLDPNSHMIYLRADYDISPDLQLGTHVWFAQNGGGGFADGSYDRGDINTPPDWTFERTLEGWPNNQFLDGIVESIFDWTVEAEYRIPTRRLKLSGSYTLEYIHNVNKVEGVHRWDHILGLGASWMRD